MAAETYSYNGDFLRNTAGFTAEEKVTLNAVNSMCSLKEFTANAYLISKVGFEFVYSSAKIEGSLITRQQTSIIISTHQAVGGLPISDVNMTANFDTAFKFIMQNDLSVNLFTMHELHAYLAKGLINNPKNIGGMKTQANLVTGGIEYNPLGPGAQLKSEANEMFSLYNQISDPFDRALYIHNNCTYLQYFADCNKRVSRCLMLVSMKHDNVLPFFTIYDKNTRNDYLDAVCDYYTSGNNQKMRKFLLDGYLKLGKVIEDAQLIKLVNGDIHSYEATAVIKTNDPLNIKIFSQIGEEKLIRQAEPGRLFFVEMYKLHGSGINPETCRAYSNLDAFLNNRLMPTKVLAKIEGGR